MQLFQVKLSVIVLCSVVAYQTVKAQASDELDTIQSLVNLSLEELMNVTFEEVSVASGFKQSMAKAPAVTSVITLQDIKASGANDLGEILRTVPGLYVMPNQNFEQNYRIRGIDSISENETLLLINGQAYKNLLDGDRGAWTGFPVENIARIEVIRGPGSALYGADAFAGVINIITKTAADIDGTEFGTRFGSEHSRDAWILHGSEHNGVEVAANLHYYTENSDYYTYRPVPPSDNEQRPTTAYISDADAKAERVNANVDINKGHWRLRMDYVSIDKSYNEEKRQTTGDRGEDENRANIELLYHNAALRPNWDMQASISYTHWNRQQYYSDNISIITDSLADKTTINNIDVTDLYSQSALFQSDLTETQLRLKNHFLYTGLQNHKVGFGIGYTDERLTNSAIDMTLDNQTHGLVTTSITDILTSTNPNPDRHSWYGFAQDSWQFTDNWELSAGLRYDDYSNFGSTLNPRLALVWQTTEKLTSKLLYGKAFIAPAYSLLNIENDSIIEPNADLQPQLIDTYELAFDYHPQDNWNGSLNLYYYEVTDKFSVEPNPERRGLSLYNSAKQSGQGGEVELNWRLSEYSKLTTHYAYTQADTNDFDLILYPRHQAYLRHHWLISSAWQFNTQVNWAKYASMEQAISDLTLPRDDSFINLDFTLHYQQANQPWQLALGVRNALDESAEHFRRELSLSERRYFIEWRYQFD